LVVRHKEADFKKAGSLVKKQIHPLPGRELALGVLPFSLFLASTLAQPGLELPYFVRQLPQTSCHAF
jgi:hypothetical protein